MKEIKQSVYEEPEIKVIRLSEVDIITTSGEEIPQEGEFIPAKVANLLK